MKNLLLILFFLLTFSTLLAQNVIKNGDIIIHLTGCDAWGAHRYNIDIYKKDNSVKIAYLIIDSMRRSELKNDAQYQRAHKNYKKYKRDDPEAKPIWDTITLLLNKHLSYTSDSIILNLKKDIAYKNLLQKIAVATKKELTPNKPRAVLDGNALTLSIMTSKSKQQISTDDADLINYPLLVGFIINTLDKDKNSSTVLKIRQTYIEFDPANNR